MKYYSEEDIRLSVKTTYGVDEDDINKLIEQLTPVEHPHVDRERIRMELWKEMMVMNEDGTVTINLANNALEAFDKKIPNS